jgi:hypothetical protein
LSGEITGEVDASRTNPNMYDTVVHGWESDTPAPNYEQASVVLSVPLRFTATKDARFLGQAEYRHSDDRLGGVKHGNGLVQIPFSRGPSGHIGGDD